MGTENHRRIRVAHLIERMDVGGMERNVELILDKLPAERFEQWLCCMSEPGPMAEPLRRRGIRVEVLGVTYYYRPSHFMRMFLHLRRLKPHVVHTHGEFAGIFGRAAGIAAGVPVVLFHAQNLPAYVQAKRTILQNRILTAASQGIIACAEDTKRYLVEGEKIPPAKVTVVHNSVDVQSVVAASSARPKVRRHFGFRPDHVVFGTVSRLAPVKGHSYLLRAAPSVVAAEPRARFLIVGGGPEMPKLDALTRELGLSAHVTFAGMRSDVPELLAAMDVFVQPTSVVEGLPLAVTEAMAAGLPVVATDVGGVREAVKNGVNGFIVRPGDVSALAHALTALACHPSRRSEMGSRSRQLCDGEFSTELMAQRVAALYTDLVRRRCPELRSC